MFLDSIVDFCHSNLLQKNSKIPLAYLMSRGVTLEDMRKYQIGYTGSILPNVEFSKEDKEDKEVFKRWVGPRRNYVRKRLVFPVYDEMGQIRGIETRSLDKNSMKDMLPRYRESLADLINALPQSEVRYKKFYLKRNDFSAIFFGLPYALDSMWSEKTVFLTEGFLDFLSMVKIKPNCLSPLTANINKYQISWLKRYVERIILLFDMDEKGKEAVSRLRKILGNDFLLYSVGLKGKDVNSFVMTYGETDLKLHIEETMNHIF